MSGAGKSTLIKLIWWLLSPQSWSISIDNEKLSDLSFSSYYKHIGYLAQDPGVFDGTIWENLTFGIDENPDKVKLREILSLAQCDFLYSLSEGLETEIGERGIKLSGWQKQRLAIAKLMLKNPSIILLDEPTSALDSISEHAVTDAMQQLFKGRTVVIIAHRLQTVLCRKRNFVCDCLSHLLLRISNV